MATKHAQLTRTCEGFKEKERLKQLLRYNLKLSKINTYFKVS